MPTVPRYDSFQAAEAPAPQVRISTPETADPGRMAQETGQSLQRAGAALNPIALDMAREANQVRVNDAMNKAVTAKLKLTYDPQEGYVHLRGDSALTRPDGKSLDQEYQAKLKEQLDQIGQSLGNEQQRAVFSQQSAQMMVQFGGSINQHVAKEYGDYQIGVQEGTVKVARDQMALGWGDAKLLDQSRNAIKAAVAEAGRLKGDSGKQIEANMVEALSPGHAAVIASAVDAGKLDYAREYMKQVGSELTPAARLQITKVLEAGDFEAKAQDGADKLYAKHKGDATAALAEARSTLTGKEEDAVVQRIKVYDAERVQLRERNQKDAADTAWGIYAQTGGIGKIPPSVIAAMDGRDLAALRKTAQAEAQAKEVKTDPAIYYALTVASVSDPAFKTEDLRRYFDKLSPADRKHFIDVQAKVIKPAEADEVATSVQQIGATIKATGLKGEDAGVFTMQAQKQLLAAERTKGSKLNQEERQKVIDRLVMQGTTPGFLFDSSTRAFKAEAEGKPFTPKFSDADKAKATAALVRQGITKPTAAQVDATIRAAYGVK